MAKILFISEKINETSWSLATALKAQNNEILFLTSRDQNVEVAQDIEVMSYFKKWSALEAFRYLPFLANLKVEIVHFLLESDRLNPAQAVLSSSSLILPTTLISTSLLNITDGLTLLNPTRYLLERSDLVTAPTIEMLAQLRGLNVKNLHQTRGVIPPLIPSVKDTPTLESSERVEELLVAVNKSDFVVIPTLNSEMSWNEDFFLSLSELSRRFFLVFQGSLDFWNLSKRKKWEKRLTHQLGNRWCLTGVLTDSEEHELLKRAWGVFLAGQNFSPTDLTHELSRTSSAGTSVIIDDLQSRLYPGLWEHQKNSWIFSRSKLKSDLEEWIQTGPPALVSNLTESLRDKQDLLDAPVNELHRLYNKALSQKSVY